MVAQYVFFRDSTGKAAKRSDDRFVPKTMLAKMGESSFLQENGQVAWKGLFSDEDPLFTSFVVIPPGGEELNEQDAKRLIWKALADVAKRSPGKPLNAKEVLNAADRHAANFYRQTSNPYVLVASLSIKAFPAKKVFIRGCEIKPLAAREPIYPLPKVLKSLGPDNPLTADLNNSPFPLVSVSCSGRTVFEAVGYALDGLGLLRALWSLAATYGRQTFRFGSILRKPIGVIHTGAVYTLYNPDGSPADEDLYWYNPDHARELELFRDDGRWPKIEKYRRWAERRLAAVPYKSELEAILLRYISALDQPNPNVAFLQLWGILEKITNTVGAKYDETIERACWVFSQSIRKLMKETLGSLRHHRNRYVHSGNAGQESDQITYRIKSYIDPHLGRLLRNTFRVNSLQEYGEVLSYPTDARELERIRSWSTRALRFVKKDEQRFPNGPT